MSKTTRREFIKKSGFTLLTVGVSHQAFLRSASMAANSALTKAAALSDNDNILVVIQCAGGNDGLNTVIPMSGSLNSAYRSLRSTLAVPQDQILSIGTDSANNQIGLHPNLAKTKALIDQKHAAVIQAVGYPDPDRSHFRSMDIWHTAAPDRIEVTGWLGDYLDATYPSNDNPLIAAYMGGTVPLGLKGHEVSVPAISDPTTYGLQTDPRYANPTTQTGEYNNRVQTFLTINRELASKRAYDDLLGPTAVDAYESAQELQTGIARYQADPGIVYNQQNPLARAMSTVAKMISAGIGTKILYVTLGGFDTHQNQAPTNGGGQPQLLGYLDDAVDTFYRDMVRLGKDQKVLIMTFSEFGRLPQQNGNDGTDHGAAAPQFVFGTPVRGGIFGVHPSLAQLNTDRPDLKYSIDFRSIYATILESWLGGDAREILGGSFALIPFV